MLKAGTLPNQNPRHLEYMSYAHGEPIPTVESVAMVAATLLGKKLTSPREAVFQAIELMESAAWALHGIKEDHDREWNSDPAIQQKEELEKIRREIRETASKHFSFSEGAKEITGQMNRRRRAEEYLQDILQSWIKIEKPDLTPEEATKELSEVISNFEKKGFSGTEVLHFQIAKAQMAKKKIGRPRKI